MPWARKAFRVPFLYIFLAAPNIFTGSTVFLAETSLLFISILNMKTSTTLFAALGLCLLGVTAAQADVTRTFTDSQGRKLEAKFIKLENDTVYIEMPSTGQMYALPLARLSPEDQAVVKTLPPAENANAMTAVATDAKAAVAAKAIDKLVEDGIRKAAPKVAELAKSKAADAAKAGKEVKPFVPLKPNPLMTDEQFVRRLYLDIAGRIPTYEETTAFLKDASQTKRGALIDKLLDSDGYTSTMYNYFAEMLRMKDANDGGANFVRGLPYIKWLKEQIKENTSWDKIVYEMISADGKVWNNGAAGYLLRDSGMPLDNLANTLSVFLGTDVACAQCHDHPFAEWTQRQFYEMASFFGATTTRLNGRDLGGMDPQKRLVAETDEIMTQSGADPKKYRNLIGNVIGANRYVVQDLPENHTKLPPDYKYHDGKPNDPVSPKLIMWSKADEKNGAYMEIAAIEKKASLGSPKKAKAAEGQKVTKAKGEVNEGLRAAFARWMVDSRNPRFAMTIANRMWARVMGVGLTQSLKSLDHPEESSNPELLQHLTNEMVRVKFNLKEFMRIVYNTQTYQREATTEELAMGEPYYFQGPMLRRMSAEQAWDSYMTLVLGQDVDKPKNTESDMYGRAVDMDLSNPKLDGKTVLLKVQAAQNLGKMAMSKVSGGLKAAGGDAKGKGKEMMMEDTTGGDEEMMSQNVLSYGGMRLMRASELEQPARPGHFLREFGQSDRLLIDGGIRSGSVPQVLMMMNGKAQDMLTNRDSLINRRIASAKDPSEKVEVVFLSILNRKPTLLEKDIAKKELTANGEQGYSNMIWALINTREFSFVE